ncbi:hypothetical protein [Cloacibacterium normanense]|uniref:hypothetical protein n=1 Tax=Cloacibacterium normanense TaxID=237258 RepID=UPI00352E04C4
MNQLNYEEISTEFKNYFLNNYRNFIDEQIKEVKNSKFLINVSDYTSETIDEPHRIVTNFLKEKNIKNHRITNLYKTFEFEFDFYLLMLTFDERRKMDIELYEEIWRHNQKL